MTLFVLGALTTDGSRIRDPWNDLRWYYDRRTSRDVRAWLAENDVPHAVGWDRLAQRDPHYPDTTVAFLTIHDPNAALEFRLRWGARITPSFAEMHRIWESEGRVTLAFDRP